MLRTINIRKDLPLSVDGRSYGLEKDMVKQLTDT